MAILGMMPHAEPAAFRAVWPVLLASVGDSCAAGALAEARRLGVGAFHMNSGLLIYAEVILAGTAGDQATARRLAGSSQPAFVNCTAWADVARWPAGGRVGSFPRMGPAGMVAGRSQRPFGQQRPPTPGRAVANWWVARGVGPTSALLPGKRRSLTWWSKV